MGKMGTSPPGRAGPAATTQPGRRPRPGNDLPEIPAKGGPQTLPKRPRIGRRSAPLPGGPSRPGTPERDLGATAEVGPAPPTSGRSPPRDGAGVQFWDATP